MPVDCEWDSYEKYKMLIGPIRDRAKELGYAIGVHGTLKRDIDLIACPWTDEAVTARELAKAIEEVINEINGGVYLSYYANNTLEFTLEGGPGIKPHGRLGWVFNLGGGPYIDLSVMPREG